MAKMELNELDMMLRTQVPEDLKQHPDNQYMRDLISVAMTFPGRRFLFGLIERSGMFTPGHWDPNRVLAAQEIIGILRATESGTSLLKTMFSENLKGADNVSS